MSLIELMMAVALLALVAAIAIPSYQQYVDTARDRAAVADIAEIAQAIQRYDTQNYRLPATLADVGQGARVDPWGHAYRYLNFANANRGQMRKDRNLVPINSDYDLYSMGKDGATLPPLTAKPSRDDIVRAGDGSFIGLASEYVP